MSKEKGSQRNMQSCLKDLKYPDSFLVQLNPSFLRRFSKIVPYMSLDEKTREKVEKARLRYGQKT